jgi:hypothetical protein
VSVLEYILEGRRELFKGLWIDQLDFDWTPTPVIHLSFGGVSADSVVKLEKGLYSQLKNIADRDGVTLNSDIPGDCLRQLIEAFHLKYGRKPAVLIDEYDALILSQIGNQSLAEQSRNSMGII